MTESDIQDAIHTMYEGDTDTPTSTDDDYLSRRTLIDAGINRWEQYEGTQWNELRVKLTDAADGDKTTSDGTLVYDCPTNFVFPGGYVRLNIGTTYQYYQVVPYEKIQLYDNNDKKICYFSGNPQDGYDLTFLDDPDGAYTISYEYYKSADTISATTTVPEMSDPYFLVYFVVSRLLQQDNRPQLAREYFTEAEARLQQMKVKNMTTAHWQGNTLMDRDFDQGIGGFGV